MQTSRHKRHKWEKQHYMSGPRLRESGCVNSELAAWEDAVRRGGGRPSANSGLRPEVVESLISSSPYDTERVGVSGVDGRAIEDERGE